MSTLFRIDFRFSGSFVEDADGAFVAAIVKAPEAICFDLNEDMVQEDLPFALEGVGVQADQFGWVKTDKARFQLPADLDSAASSASGWPVFTQGAAATRFLRVEAPQSEALVMAIHNACLMASVSLSHQDRAVYDDSPTVTVNAIEHLDDAVDPRSPHERRADGLVAAINTAVLAGNGDGESGRND